MAVIDRDRWRELARLLDQVLELTDDERAAWMEELRSRSPDLAAELTALLAGEANADREGFLHGPLDSGARDTKAPETDLGAYLQRSLGDTYTIDRELGGGGMSRVFIAREHALGRTVVIKVLLPLLAAGVRAERFAREVRLVATLQHPNVVPLFTAGEAGGLPYYVMPYVPGESLRARLTREQRLPLHDALSVLRDVARALAFAHEQGVVHRDIKPDNVLLAGDAAVVTDFGIAKAVFNASDGEAGLHAGRSASELRTISTLGTALGTPAYMAPEQAVGNTPTDHRADIYSWGILAYELLAGQHPFANRATPQELVAAQLSEKPAPLSNTAPDLAPTLDSLVMRALEKNPAHRPQSAREILDALAVVATPPERSVVSRWRARRPTWRAVMVGLGVLCVAAVALAVTQRRTNPSNGQATGGSLSLAVLPFEAVGGDTANAYFGEGIADEIATALSKAGGLRIASPTSVAAFRSNHDADVQAVGRRLGVASILEGHVRRSGDRMRLTVQLTSVADGLVLWSDSYERQIRDVFQVQDQIARSIVDALRVRLPTATRRLAGAFSSAGTTNPDAYDLYLRGSYLRERRSGGVSRAIEYFQRAIAEDSGYARAYAGLAYALVLSPIFDGAPAPAADRQAMEAAQHALALDSTLAEAYTALGVVHWHAMRWREAGEAFKHAIAADPDYAPGQYHYADYLLRVGHVAEAEVPARRARADDPLSATASTLLAYALSLLGRYDESLTEGRRAFELDSSLHTVHARLALAVLTDGRPAEAHALAAVAKLPIPFSGSAGYVLGASGDTVRAKAVLHELETLSHGEWQVAPSLTYIYLGLGDTTRALSALEEAARVGDVPIIPLADPMFDRIRQSPRFAAAVRRLGLVDGALTRPLGGRPR